MFSYCGRCHWTELRRMDVKHFEIDSLYNESTINSTEIISFESLSLSVAQSLLLPNNENIKRIFLIFSVHGKYMNGFHIVEMKNE